MAAAAQAVRFEPSGIHLYDGYTTFVAITSNLVADAPGNYLWEVTVTTPGIDGGDPINQDTMWNLVWHTVSPRHLKTLMEFTFVAGWDPSGFAVLSSYINVIVNITVYYPDGSTLTFWGFMRKVEPQEHKEGEMPKINVTVTPCLLDPSHPEGRPDIETPTLTAAAGTGLPVP